MTKKNFSLIKQMNEQIDQRNEVADQSTLSEADMSSSSGDIKSKFNSLQELQRIADYWKEHGKDLDDAELRERIGMDLEQLEYSPDQQAEAIPKIMKMVRGDDENVNEQYLHEQLNQGYGVLVLKSGTEIKLDGSQAHCKKAGTGTISEVVSKCWSGATNPVVSIKPTDGTSEDQELSVVLNGTTFGPDEIQALNQYLRKLVGSQTDHSQTNDKQDNVGGMSDPDEDSGMDYA